MGLGYHDVAPGREHDTHRVVGYRVIVKCAKELTRAIVQKDWAPIGSGEFFILSLIAFTIDYEDPLRPWARRAYGRLVSLPSDCRRRERGTARDR